MTPEAVRMMDEELLDQINSHVDENDTLWMLGDFCFAREQEYFQVAKSYRKRIRCRNINYVYGNHDDWCLRDVFENFYVAGLFRIQGHDIFFSHYAHAIWNKSHRRSIMLYGHSHSTAEKWLEQIMPGRRSMDVGVDNAAKILGSYRPFAMSEILDIMRDRPGFFFDHHIDPNAPTEEQLAE